MPQLIPMRTGRILEVQEYGEPNGHPAFFFHGLIGSHYQASYIDEQARQHGLRVIAPNRPGVGRSEFIERQSPLEAVPDVEDLAASLQIEAFSVIGISGGTPYCWRVSTASVRGSAPRRSSAVWAHRDCPTLLAAWTAPAAVMEVGSRYPQLAKQESRRWGRFRVDPRRFLDRLVATWPEPDRALFQRPEIFDLFLCDLRQVFVEGNGPETFAQELRLYRHYGFSLSDLSPDRHVTLWHGLDDIIVPPTMAWQMTQALPCCEAHLVPGGQSWRSRSRI